MNKCRLDGNTLLHIASRQGNAEVVSVLMAYNASLTVKNDEGQLPIDVAANDQIRTKLAVVGCSCSAGTVSAHATAAAASVA